MEPRLDHARTDDEITATFEVMRQMRPELVADGYLARIRALMDHEGLRLLALSDDGVVRGVAAYRVMDMLYCGRLLYVDDLVVDERVRSRGYGARLLERLEQEGRALGCSEIQLISRVTREQAHRFYFRQGFGIECFHFRRRLG
ncbi:GNAT family N-acetyltransferase [Fulvimonas yonginensis]|uniref:GNAT family N-acetyltransferase n=1 Tax=Fulvimonas yonginensis TaxID=1495200 RepID=A0ABU8JE68_9GAMM